LTTHFVVAAAVSGGRIFRPADEDIGSYNAQCEISLARSYFSLEIAMSWRTRRTKNRAW
jgi:hypothetical protein